MEGKLAVIVLAAGQSTRFKSRKTKVMHELAGKPIIEWVLDAVTPLNPVQVIVVYGTHSVDLTDIYRDGYGTLKLDFVLQDPPQGTGHALMQVEQHLHDGISEIMVLPGDAPLINTGTLCRLADARHTGQATHSVLTASVPDPTGYGRVVRSATQTGRVAEIVEHKDANKTQREIHEVNSGMYVFDRSVFDNLRDAAASGPSEVTGEYYLPEVVKLAPTVAVKAESHEDMLGINSRVELAEVEGILQARLREHWMREGVTFHLPESTYLHYDVQLAPDVEIGPHCVLTKGTRIAEGTELSEGCRLETCVVGRNCTLLHVRGLMAVIENNVTIGPYVNLRPGTVLHDNVKVGNFVETKNADIGEGSKLPHLQYIGDATLGEACNIGAGTIFCNYDGYSKLHTVLGKGVFIGSNSSLQGGIEIEEGAYVAMASAITKNVPSGALAVGRARQENKEGYVAKLRERLAQKKEKLSQEQTREAGE